MIMRSLLSLICLFATTLSFAGSGTAPTLEKLLRQAEDEAPQEIQFHILKTQNRLSNFIAKTRNVEKIDGWQQIRASGDAAYAVWDNSRKDFVWRGGKFEVVFEITNDSRLKPVSVTFDGTTHRVEE